MLHTVADWSQALGPVANVLVAAVGIGFTVQVQRLGRQLTLDIKRGDTVSDFHRRYGDIDLLKLRPEVMADLTSYYGRFWSLQSDQFDAWNAGLVSHEEFESWMLARKRAWDADENRYQELSRTILERYFHGTAFRIFMEHVHDDPADACRQQRTDRYKVVKTYFKDPPRTGSGPSRLTPFRRGRRND